MSDASFRRSAAAALVLLWVAIPPSAAQNMAFTYQGQLNQGGQLANGSYDFQFALFDSGDFLQTIAFADPLNILDVQVIAGTFSAELDFGPGVFGDVDLWLEIRVRESGSTGPLTTLSPRQRISAVPLALVAEMSSVAGVADLAASVAPGSVGNAQLAASAVTGDKVATGSIFGSDIANNSITSSDIADGSITSSDIANNSVAGVDLGSSVFTRSTVTRVTTSGTSEPIVSADLGSAFRRLCFLSTVRVNDVDGSSEYAECEVDIASGRWRVRALARPNDDNDATCEAYCISW
ncbi:MAG: hypothetical protein AAF358_16425 [Pseudomonadota bacterium]